ncbi:MAG TPA: hypothetical protein VFZ84_04400 [Burkholderiales bacterium]
MAYRLNALRGSCITARDGPAGLLNDVLFEQDTLAPHYVAIDQGDRFPGRRVLVPAARVALDPSAGMRVDLTREQLRRCISADKHARLVSGRALWGYRIEASGRPIGHADDLLLNGDWSVAGLVAATRDWLLPGRKLEIAASAIVARDAARRTLRVDLRLEPRVQHTGR